jgi:hypothetical protein
MRRSIAVPVLMILILRATAEESASAPDPAVPKPAPARASTVERVPYRLTETNHILLRAKLNKKGPYNLILDTGAPAVCLLSKAAEEIGLTIDEDGWALAESMDLEGGVSLAGVRVRPGDHLPLLSLNDMNLPGVRLDGVIGYAALARFRIDIDLTRRYMLWKPLDYDPPPPPSWRELRENLPEGAQASRGPRLGLALARLMSAVVKDNRPVVPRGYLGFEVEEKGGAVVVKAVYAGSPANKAGLFAGDVLAVVRGRPIASAADLDQAAGRVAPDDAVRLHVVRSGVLRTVTVRAAEGL